MILRRKSSWASFTRSLKGAPLWYNLFLVAVVAGLFMGGTILLWFVTLDIPSVDSFHNRLVAESTKIYDRTGDVLLYDVHGTVRRTVVDLEEVSRHVKNATIAIEDAEFYEHYGVKPDAIVRAVLTNLIQGKLLSGQGGSTITQQVIKNTVLTNEKTVTRKVKEWILALKIEKQLTKDEILEIYLNETPYGGTIYGVEEASLNFFGKPAAEVELVEAAYLAALPQAPTYYSPYGNHRDDLENRKNLVLERMYENGFITEEEKDLAQAESVEFLGSDEGDGAEALHFIFYVREYLEEEYGVNAVNEEGLKVVTTLDYELQKAGEQIVCEYALRNEEQFNAENAALVAIDPATGQILTMVGSRGYQDEEIDGKFNAALGKRQPGSAFKPFIYATAFAQGYTPETILFDLRTQFSTSCSPQDVANSATPCYSPQNYDHEFRGPMTIRNALAQSINIPAVKTLYLTGIRNAIETAERMGITTLVDPNRYGLTLVLGGGEVTLLEMVSAYGVFANEGVRHEPIAILRVEDADGKVLEEYKPKNGERALDPNVARQISDVLSDNVARTPLFGANSPLTFGSTDVAAKTGTTNDNRDAWIIGYTPTLVVGAWAGNNIPEPMNQISGLIVTPLWRAFMDKALSEYTTRNFTPPNPPEEGLPPVLSGVWNQRGSDGRVHSILHWIQKSNPRGGQPGNPASDGQYAYWEYPVSLWSETQGLPSGENGVGTETTFRITNPTEGSTIASGESFTTAVAIPQGASLSRVIYSLNGENMGGSTQAPYALSITPPGAGTYTLRAVGESPSGTYSSEITFTVE